MCVAPTSCHRQSSSLHSPHSWGDCFWWPSSSPSPPRPGNWGSCSATSCPCSQWAAAWLSHCVCGVCVSGTCVSVVRMHVCACVVVCVSVMHVHLFHVAIETTTSKPNNSCVCQYAWCMHMHQENSCINIMLIGWTKRCLSHACTCTLDLVIGSRFRSLHTLMHVVRPWPRPQV